jgi:ABC-type bacteriocin/lantibiotic exporter with double-glycine peptidase domain
VVLLPPLFLKGLFDFAYPYKDVQLLLWLSIVPFALSFCFNILNSLKGFLDLYVYQKVLTRLNDMFYLKLQRLPMSFFYLHRVGDLMFRATSDLQNVTHAILSITPNIISTTIKLSLMIALCLMLNPTLTALALIGIPFQFWETHYFAKKLKENHQECEEMSADHYNFLEERISHIKVVKLLHHWSTELKALSASIQPIFRAEVALTITNALKAITGSTLAQFWTIVLSIYTGYSIISGAMTLGEVVAITAYLLMLQQPFQTLSSLYQQLKIAHISFARLATVLDHPEEEQSQLQQGKDVKLSGDIRFENLSFGYDKGHIILNNINFHIKAGHTLAIVGKSGIGKSSLTDLLLGFYEPTEGQIYLDHMSIQRLKLTSLRSQIGLVSQESPLFFGSIRDNILFGIQTSIGQDEIERCARLADAHDFIMQLPDGYDTATGPNGASLSSGQRQRIAIARALLSDPPILIFDEATAVLDGESETQIQNTLEKFKGKKTIILIAHRLSSLKLADHVLVLGADGRIVEEGSVPELMAKTGRFYQLYESQISGFQYMLQHMQLLMKSVKRYQRPLCVASIQIQNYAKLRDTLPESMMDHVIASILNEIRSFIRDVDYAAYQAEGRFWILLPETPIDGAHIACQRLIERILIDKLTLGYNVLQCKPDDLISSIIHRLSGDQNALS